MKNTFKVLAVKLDILEIKEVIDTIEDWISTCKRDSAKYICVTNVNSVVEAQKNSYLKEITNQSDISVCDGMPLVWLAKFNGFKLRKRVYGYALMRETFKVAQDKGYSNYFYGSTESTLKNMLLRIKIEYPKLKISGVYSPPFRELKKEEKEEIINNINNSKADIVWVGLGYPKQEIWMYEFRNRLKCSALIGVGAAFNFYSGNKKQAPRLMQDAGLEWFFRLICEPKRLWKRYLVNNILFIFLIIKDAIFSVFFTNYVKNLPKLKRDFVSNKCLKK